MKHKKETIQEYVKRGGIITVWDSQDSPINAAIYMQPNKMPLSLLEGKLYWGKPYRLTQEERDAKGSKK